MVNINTAGVSELEKLPGIGPGKARAIVEYRQQKGPFRSIEELMQVPGIKEGTFARLKAYVTV
ncbi:MAG: helix-hairpin-helix domain-containing protein [Lachnospiraceae bacterium]|nr:helix-hairpin-helix domain-containing protein [Lachnospiraceae bacterium]